MLGPIVPVAVIRLANDGCIEHFHGGRRQEVVEMRSWRLENKRSRQ